MRILLILVASTFLTITETKAQTVYGALAIDRSNGFYYGWAYDYATLSGAQNRALKECRAKGGNCEVVVTWEGKGCGVYRTIPGTVGTAYGWGVARTQTEADAIATREALKRSGGVQPTNYVWACNSVGDFKPGTAPTPTTASAGTGATDGTSSKKLTLKDDEGEEYEYEGELQNNQPHGKGKQTYVKSGSVYTGQFKNGEKQGTGIIVWKSGSTYTGNWEKGVPHGKGVYQWASGSRYDGEWANGKMQGTGTWSTTTGVYVGQFKNGKMHGSGTLTAKSGQEIANTPKATKYVGEYQNGERNGYGKCYNKEGQLIYSGYFSNDKPTGQYPQ